MEDSLAACQSYLSKVAFDRSTLTRCDLILFVACLRASGLIDDGGVRALGDFAGGCDVAGGIGAHGPTVVGRLFDKVPLLAGAIAGDGDRVGGSGVSAGDGDGQGGGAAADTTSTSGVGGGSGVGDSSGGVHSASSGGVRPGNPLGSSGVSGSSSRGCLPGETTKERNQRWKAEKKEKKERRKLNRMSAEIAKGPKAVERMVVERRGYFSACPEDVQQELRNTRAALLIAQNKRELALAERKQRMLTSDVTLVRDVLNVVKLQEQVEKVTKRKNEVRVGGWAQTVLSATSSEMVDRAASRPNSSIPTLSSISIGDCVDSSQKEKRELQYKLALAEIEANIGEIGLQYEEEIEQARARVKEEFSDVAYSDELRFKREFIAAMARDMTLSERARLFTLAEAEGIDLDGLQY